MGCRLVLGCVLCQLVLLVNGGYYPAANYDYSPYQTEYAHNYDNYEPHDYQFEYAVSDPHTGDHKSQWEVKDKGVVRGSYSLLEPDGTTRVVEYVADDHGFRAVVKKLGHSIHPQHTPDYGTLVPLPEAYNTDYRGVYDGEIQNYIGTYASPLVGHEEAVPYLKEEAVPIPYLQKEISLPYLAKEVPYYPIKEDVVPIKTIQEVVPIPYLQKEVSLPYLEKEVPYFPIKEDVVPIKTFQDVVPFKVIQESIPIKVVQESIPHETVELHGFTGNIHDDSAYTNFDDGKKALYYQAQPTPYATSYQSSKMWG